MLIAIDGSSASGKSTIAKNLSNHYNIPYLNTGSLYRALGFLVLNNNIDINDIDEVVKQSSKISRLDLNNKNLQNEQIGKIASIISQKKQVRKALYNFQIDFKNDSLAKYNGAILEGRDIGTVICPEADFKFFIELEVEIRADRRFKQLQQDEPNISLSKILQDLKVRDENDKNRTLAPLMKADDAIVINNSKAPQIILQQIIKIIDG